MVTRIVQIGMPILIFIWGNIESGLAWNLSDLALGSCTWINMLVVLLLLRRYLLFIRTMRSR